MRALRLAVTTLVAAALTATAGVPAASGAAGSGLRPATDRSAMSSTAAALTSPGFVAVQPKRLLDTRRSATVHALGQGRSTSLKVTGVAAVPASGVTAVAVNVTGIAQAATTYLTVYPTGRTRPTASNLNLVRAQPRANEVIATVGTGGAITIFNAVGNTDVLVDVTGYFRAGSSYTGQSPVRIVDTRRSGGPVSAGRARNIPLTGHGGVPTSGVSAVVLNLTAVSTSVGGYLTAWAAGTVRPKTSNLNVGNRKTAAVLVVAPVGAGGAVDIFSSGGPTHLVVDVAGWFSGYGDYHPIHPTRVLNTATLSGSTFAHDIQFAANYGGAAVLSVTAADPDRTGFVTVHPGGSPTGGTSSVNVAAHATTANLVIGQLSSAGTLALYDDVHDGRVVVDVVGYFTTNRYLTFPSPTPGLGEVTQPYSYPVLGASGLPPYTAAVTGGSLPAGLALSSAGLVSGTPTTTGQATATVTLTDSSGASVSRPLTVKVIPFATNAVWGWGAQGLLGSGAPTRSAVPLRVSDLSSVTQTAVDSRNGYALRSDGTVAAWGDGAVGGLGNGAQSSSAAPVTVSNLTSVTRIVAAGSTAYALTADGTVWAWGAGAAGQLGNGGTSDSSLPVAVTGLTNVIAIGAANGIGSPMTTGYAVRSDGTVWAWGAGALGQLGNGTTTPIASSPVPVNTLSGITSVAGGAATGYAVRSDGTLWSWGQNSYGQIGDGTSLLRNSPVQVSGLSGVTEVAGGALFALARESDGTAWAWGNGGGGQLGDGQYGGGSGVPVRIAALSDVDHVSAGAGGGYAVTSGGRLWSWGPRQDDGMLGDGVAANGGFSVVAPESVLTPPVAAVTSSASVLTALAIGVP